MPEERISDSEIPKVLLPDVPISIDEYSDYSLQNGKKSLSYDEANKIFNDSIKGWINYYDNNYHYENNNDYLFYLADYNDMYNRFYIEKVSDSENKTKGTAKFEIKSETPTKKQTMPCLVILNEIKGIFLTHILPLLCNLPNEIVIMMIF